MAKVRLTHKTLTRHPEQEDISVASDPVVFKKGDEFEATAAEIAAFGDRLEILSEPEPEPEKRGPGRPRGSANKPAE